MRSLIGLKEHAIATLDDKKEKHLKDIELLKESSV